MRVSPQVGQRLYKINAFTAFFLFKIVKVSKCYLEADISLKFYQISLIVLNSWDFLKFFSVYKILKKFTHFTPLRILRLSFSTHYMAAKRTDLG